MKEKEWLDIFGDNLRDMIADRGMTQGEFADELGVSRTMVNLYINKKVMPTTKMVINMSYVLNTSLDTLIDFGEQIT